MPCRLWQDCYLQIVTNGLTVFQNFTLLLASLNLRSSKYFLLVFLSKVTQIFLDSTDLFFKNWFLNLDLFLIALLGSLVTKLEWLSVRNFFFQGNMFIHCIDDSAFKSFKIHWRIFLYFLKNYAFKCLTIKVTIVPVRYNVGSLLWNFKFEESESDYENLIIQSQKFINFENDLDNG